VEVEMQKCGSGDSDETLEIFLETNSK